MYSCMHTGIHTQKCLHILVHKYIRSIPAKSDSITKALDDGDSDVGMYMHMHRASCAPVRVACALARAGRGELGRDRAEGTPG